MVSVLVKLVPVTVRLLVLLVDVIEVLLGPAPRRSEAAVLLPEPVHPNVRVRFAGTLLKVNRMFVPFVTATPLEELWVAVLRACWLPSTIIKDARLSDTVRFVKTVAVPSLGTAFSAGVGSVAGDVFAPIARPVIPGPSALMSVGVSVGAK
jgi:hypothetical protein